LKSSIFVCPAAIIRPTCTVSLTIAVQFDPIQMPSASIRQYKAAVVQSEPGWFDLQRCIQMTVDLILEAGEKGCMLIAFPEICKHDANSLP
jgi:hypothetical protein